MMGLPALADAESDGEEAQPEGGVRFPVSNGDDADGDDEASPAMQTEVVSSDALPFDFDSMEGFGDEESEEDEGATRSVDPDVMADAMRPEGASKNARSSREADESTVGHAKGASESKGADSAKDIDDSKKAKARRLLDKVKKTDRAEKEVVTDTVIDALRGENRGPKATAFGLPSVSAEDDEDGDDAAGTEAAAKAWGLDDEGDSEADADATKVLDPDTLTGLEADLGEESSEEVQDQRFGTLMGMSLEEEREKSAAGAMHRGARGDEDQGEVHDATAALSPEELAQLDELSFADEWDDASGEEQTSAEGQQRSIPGAGQTESGEENAKTAVLGSSMSPEGFQLPKPESKGPSQVPSPDDGDDAKEGSSDFDKRSTPQSGVFRSAERARKNSEQSESGRSSQKDSGVVGTGTYQMSHTDSAAAEDEDLDDEKLKLGAVGGSRTSFPTGGDDDEASADSRKREPAPVPTPDTGTAASSPSPGSSQSGSVKKEPSTGPRFEIGQGSGGGPSVGGTDVETSSTEAEASALPEVEPEPLDAESVEPALVEPEPLEQEPIGGTPERPSEGPVTPEPQAPQENFGAQPASQDSDGAEPASQENVGAQPAPQASQENFGAQPASQENVGAQPAPQASQNNFGAQPAPQASQNNFGAQPAPQSPEEQESTGDDEQSDIERLISIAQSGTGIFAGVTLLLATIAVLVMEGMPEGTEMAVLLVPLVFGLGAMVISPIPMGKNLKSALLGLVGMTVLIGSLATVAVEMGLVLAMGQLAGATFLFFAAGFPLLGKLATK